VRLLANGRAANRLKDLEDVEALELDHRRTT
jgi:hypothetical protein